MTSKEKIEVVKALQHCGIERYRLALEEIEKDLEVLEIFKEQLHIYVYKAYFNDKPMYFLKIFEADIFITKEIYDKLKKWLENDNVRERILP